MLRAEAPIECIHPILCKTVSNDSVRHVKGRCPEGRTLKEYQVQDLERIDKFYYGSGGFRSRKVQSVFGGVSGALFPSMLCRAPTPLPTPPFPNSRVSQRAFA